MITLRHILCPVDFSIFSHRALQHAVRLARWFGSPLTVLYVYPVPVTPPPVFFDGVPGQFGEPYPAPAVSPERVHEDMLAELTAFAASVDTSGVRLNVHARAGTVVRGILDEAAGENTDLIVIGTHGHSGFDRWVLGSVTEKILRKAQCAVLTVPPPAGEPGADTVAMFKRILCPIDFSEPSLKALEYALALAKEADADLLLMHVIEGLGDPPHWQQPTDPAVLEYVRMSKENALARLRQIVPADAQTWCRPRQILAIGKPHAQILRIVQEEDVHLIVMGVHGRNPIDRLFFGSTTNHLVRASTCPVLTLKV